MTATVPVMGSADVPAPMGVGRGLLKAMRPKQWAKNVLVFAAPAAAGVIDEWWAQWRSVAAFVAFCLAASGTYLFNDLADIERDRNHPTKRFRPLAAGVVSPRLAIAVGVVLLVASIGLATSVGRWQFVVVIVAYVAMTLAYTFKLKHYAVVDLMTVSMGFVLRAIGGATAVGVPASRWFVITISGAAMLVVTGKRYVDLVALGDGAASTRATLQAYSPEYLRIVIGVSLAGGIGAYCLWAFEKSEYSGTSWPLFELSIVPMVVALLRYALLLDGGHGSAPEEVFASDRVLQALGLIWGALFLAGVYVG